MKTLRLATTLAGILTAPIHAMPLLPPVTISTFNPAKDWLVVAELTGDARPDILCAAPAGGLRLFRNLDGSSFNQEPDIAVSGGVPVAAVAANIDRDLDNDLVVLIDPGNAAAKVYFYTRNTNGSFTKSDEVTLSGKLIPGSPMMVEDIDQDGDVDVVTAHQDAAQAVGMDLLVVVKNNGSGDFGSPLVFDNTLNWPTALAFHDADEDGRRDLLAGMTGTQELRCYHNNSPGEFGGPVTVADTPDGIAEICGFGKGSLFLRYNGPGAGLDSGINYRLSYQGLLDWSTFPAGEQGADVTSLTFGDADEDGGRDIFFLRSGAQQAATLVFIRWDRTPGAVNIGDAAGAKTLRAEDMDGDGDTDLVLLAPNKLMLRLSNSIRPQSEFVEFQTLTLAHPAPDVLATADLAGTTTPELIGASSQEGSIRTWNVDNYFLEPGSILATGLGAISSLKTCDMDRNGTIDLVFNAPGAGRVQWLRNNGDGTFSSPNTILAKAGPGPVDAADIDHDGDMDVAMAFNDGTLIVALNNGVTPNPGWTYEAAGSFGTNLAYDVKIARTSASLREHIFVQRFVFGWPSSALVAFRHVVFPNPAWNMEVIQGGEPLSRGIATADVDHDGDLDLISGPGQKPGIYFNNGLGVFDTEQFTAPAEFTGMNRLRIEDFERDGTPEVFCVSGSQLLASPVTSSGIGAPLNVKADYTGKQLRDAVVFPYYGRGALVVSDATTPALRVALNDLAQITHDGNPTGPDTVLRGDRAAPFSVVVKNIAPAGGPDVKLSQFSFNVRKNTAGQPAMEEAEFASLVESFELWDDHGIQGQLEPWTDSMFHTESGSLNGPGGLNVHIALSADPRLTLAPQEARSYLLVLNLKPQPVPGLTGLILRWGGQTDNLYAAAVDSYTTLEVPFGEYFEKHLTLTSATPLQLWRLQHWGIAQSQGIAADNADPDEDGLANLTEYALGSDPKSLTSDGALQPFIDAQGRRAVKAFLSAPPRPDITITFESSATMMAGAWTTLAARTGAGAWTGPGVVTVAQFGLNNRLSYFIAENGAPQGAHKFVRMKVSY